MKTSKLYIAAVASIALALPVKATVHLANTTGADIEYYYLTDSCYWEHQMHKTTTNSSTHTHYEFSYYYGTPDDPCCDFYEYNETDTTIDITHDDYDECDTSLTTSLVELGPDQKLDAEDSTEYENTDFSQDPSLNEDLYSEDGDLSNPDYGWWDTNDTNLSTTGYESYLRTHTYT